MALAQVGSAGRGGRLILALEDRLLRESLAMALTEEGFRVREFDAAEEALGHIEAGAGVDALVVDDHWTEAGEPPRVRLHAARCASPVYVLSLPNDVRGQGRNRSRKAAERWGAAGVIDRTQPLQSLRRNLTNAIRAGALLGDAGAAVEDLGQGPLVFGAGGTRVSWKGSYLDLNPAEQALLSGLVTAPDPGLTYQRAQTILMDLDGGENGRAAKGGGNPDRVKSLVRRLRKKFREVDPDFDQIVFVAGCGYGWRGREASLEGENLR